MAREKFEREQFKRYVLPSLIEKHGRDIVKINAAIKNNFTITDPDDGARIDFTVGFDPSCAAQPTQQVDVKAIHEAATKAAKDAIAEIEKQARIKNPPPGIPTTKGFNMISATSSRSRVFKGADGAEKAHRLGAWALATVGNENCKSWCETHGLPITKSGHNEGSNFAGGYLVPLIIDTDLIDLRNIYGTFRRNSRVRPMSSDTLSVPRRTGGLTATFVAEGGAGTGSNKTWDSVQLVAKKVMILAKVSSELNEDSIVDLGDDLAQEIVWAFSKLEDDCGFNGDGTSDFGGIVGVCAKLLEKWTSTSASSAGVVIASGNAFGEVTLADLHGMVARCPTFARRGAKWFASPSFVDGTMIRLALAVGGATLADVVRGDVPSFLGYPVERTESMPATDVNSQVACVFGDLAQGSSFGDRRQTSILISPHGVVDGVDVFGTDQLAIRGTQRFDIVVHDVGDGTATAGPLIGLRMAAA